jgi:hypothetical protein
MKAFVFAVLHRSEFGQLRYGAFFVCRKDLNAAIKAFKNCYPLYDSYEVVEVTDTVESSGFTYKEK